MTEISVLITGDFCPTDRLKSLSDKSDPGKVLSGLSERIKNADLAVTNLECPVTACEEAKKKTGPNLKSKPEAVDFLINSGFNLVTLANNHIMDYGDQGLKETLEHLKNKNLPFVGAGKNLKEAGTVFYYQKDNLKIGVINVAENEWSTTHGETPGANPIEVVHVFRSIVETKKNADVIIIIAHGGHEMYELPSPRMVELFRGFVEMGADAVINHHTHCVSGFEVYNGKPIFYSLGNFLFDNSNERNGIWNVGQAVQLNIKKDSISFESIYFRQCDAEAGVISLSDAESEKVHQNVKTLNGIISDASKLEAAFDKYCVSKSKMYKSFLEPRKNKYITALQNRNLLPSFWSKNKKLLLENLIRCEAHRDVVLKILKK